MNEPLPQPTKIDRLASLVDTMSVVTVSTAPISDASFWIIKRAGHFQLCPGDCKDVGEGAIGVVVNWGARISPLDSLAGKVLAPIESDHVLFPILELLHREVSDPRCGSRALVSGYCEVIIVQMLRDALEKGLADIGVLSGLSDPRLAVVLVALHKAPGRHWRADDLAVLAGMSRSAFMERFVRIMGEGPMSYLRRLRLDQARQALKNGRRVNEVARQFGYKSPDAFSRAFRKAVGVSPSQMERPQ